MKKAASRAPRAPDALCCLPAQQEAELSKRLAAIQGHVVAIRRMSSEGRSCDELAHQALAVRSALNAWLDELVRAHMTNCVITAMVQGKGELPLERFQKLASAILKRN